MSALIAFIVAVLTGIIANGPDPYTDLPHTITITNEVGDTWTRHRTPFTPCWHLEAGDLGRYDRTLIFEGHTAADCVIGADR